jgi:tetratricopeptide (TPR) repeat protein
MRQRRSGRRSSKRVWCAALSSLLLVSAASAQRGDVFNGVNSTTSQTPGYQSHGGATLLLTIFTQKAARLDRQSVVKLHNHDTDTVSWQTSNDRSEAGFGDVPFGHYDIEVSAVGYLTAHKDLQVISATRPYELEIKLEPDPSAIELNAPEGPMPSKARNETKRAVSALKSGNLKEAKKRLDEAYKLVPSSPDLNFLLGYLFFQERDFDRAQTFLSKAAALKPRDVQVLDLLGRVGLQREDYPAARSALEQAVAADADDWMAHNLLANAYLKQQDYGKARDEAQLALDKGQKGASSAQLVLGQALVNLGKSDDGIHALKTFLQDSPRSPSAAQVRTLIAEIEKRESDSAQNPGNAPNVVASLAGVDPMLGTAEPVFSLKPWAPLSIDDTKPSVAAGIACPNEKISEMSGERVSQLVEDVSRFAAIEELQHERLDQLGNPVTKETRKFNYVVSISESQPGFSAVDEYRAEHLGLDDFPDQIASSGFAALALVFHPSMRDNFRMTCEGLGDWHGQATWLVRFQQRDDRPSRMHDYKINGQLYSVKLKGRAWITADDFQIVKIESDLVNPMRQIRLQTEHQIVEYGPIPFPKKNEVLWLPKSAEIYFDFRRRRYYRRHSFDHYMLFSVATDEKRKEPQAPPAEKTSAPNL